MLELTIEDLSFVKIDLDVERIVHKNCVILLVIHLEESVSKNRVGLLDMLEGCFELSLSQGYFG